MSNPVACTIATYNYLPFVRVLARSLRAHHPNLTFKVLLVGSEEQCTAAEREGFDVIRAHALDIPELSDILRRYGRKQICAALKPSLLRHLLEHGYASAIFLDPDILVTHSLEPVFTCASRHALTLTPHLHTPSRNVRGSGLERAIRLTGTYNAGFIGVSDREETRQFLTWWESRLRKYCVAAVKAGIFSINAGWILLLALSVTCMCCAIPVATWPIGTWVTSIGGSPAMFL